MGCERLPLKAQVGGMEYCTGHSQADPSKTYHALMSVFITLSVVVCLYTAAAIVIVITLYC